MGDPKALMKEADECLKLNWMKWEADHLAAASLYEQAGKIFRGRGDAESAVGAYVKAAKSHLSKGGRGYEAAAAAYQMAGQASPERSSEMFSKSVDLYMTNGSLEEALKVMERAAESFERAGDKESSLNLYARAVDLVNIDQDTRGMLLQQFWALMNTAFRKLIAGRRLAEATKCANKMLAIQKLRNEKSPKMVLQIIILYLARGDIGGVRQLLNQNLEDPEFFRSSECEAAQQLLEAWEKMDSDAIRKLAEGSPIKYLDAQVVYLARELSPENKSGSTSQQRTVMDSSSTRTSTSAKSALFSTSTPSRQGICDGDSNSNSNKSYYVCSSISIYTFTTLRANSSSSSSSSRS